MKRAILSVVAAALVGVAPGAVSGGAGDLRTVALPPVDYCLPDMDCGGADPIECLPADMDCERGNLGWQDGVRF